MKKRYIRKLYNYLSHGYHLDISKKNKMIPFIFISNDSFLIIERRLKEELGGAKEKKNALTSSMWSTELASSIEPISTILFHVLLEQLPPNSGVYISVPPSANLGGVT